jgi:hypothetical protein
LTTQRRHDDLRGLTQPNGSLRSCEQRRDQQQLAHGEDGAYRNKPIPVLAKQVHEPLCVARSAGDDLLRGRTGDWVQQYALGDSGPTGDARFRQVYRPVGDAATTA